MPVAAKVLIIESDTLYLERAKTFLSSHLVVGEVSIHEDFVNQRVLFGQLGLDVAIIDAGLLPALSKEAEGHAIADWLRQNIPRIKIIEWSSEAHGFGDVFVTKGFGDADLTELFTAVTDLPRE